MYPKPYHVRNLMKKLETEKGYIDVIQTKNKSGGKYEK